MTTANPAMTDDEFSRQLEDSGAKWIVCSDDKVEAAAKAAMKHRIPLDHVVTFDPSLDKTVKAKNIRGILEAMKAQHVKEEDVFVDVPERDLELSTAILPYSSGTTGTAKGVCLSHYNVMANLLQQYCVSAKYMDPKSNSSLCILPTLSRHGHDECTAAYDISGNQKYKLTNLPLVPPVCLLLAKSPLVDSYDLSSITRIAVGAAPLGRDLELELKRRFSGAAVFQGYGLTEMTKVGLRIQKPQSTSTSASAAISGTIGCIVPNMECKVIDDEGKELGPNIDGEICVRGPNVTRQYLAKPEATKLTIVDGWLHTGDIGHYDDRQLFYIVDRKKELIKYKGLQVAPAELENHLLTHPDVIDAAAIPLYDPSQATELPLAFVVLRDGAKTHPDEIRAYVDGKVANHKKLRGGVRIIDAIPKSASGKILRRILKDKINEEQRGTGTSAKL
ncbi:hypothetical protein BZG36_05625 [Bifiguratus adelaidae]|uniref:AMP-dependent synthetase/ligase domain-containing protein n=1 Tax=Bifiguratus adelaidae TaxID=1938954 RepID=A0A261XSN3_9FUNG|nr:hypothetical protein BZG36_05625 [Bifiguratus adelaidae]